MTTTRSDWTGQQERLLFAAQAVVQDADEYGRDHEDNKIVAVDCDVYAELKRVVQEIHDDTLRTIRAAAREVTRVATT